MAAIKRQHLTPYGTLRSTKETAEKREATMVEEASHQGPGKEKEGLAVPEDRWFPS